MLGVNMKRKLEKTSWFIWAAGWIARRVATDSVPWKCPSSTTSEAIMIA
jgi:hypothetical protein